METPSKAIKDQDKIHFELAALGSNQAKMVFDGVNLMMIAPSFVADRIKTRPAMDDDLRLAIAVVLFWRLDNV